VRRTGVRAAAVAVLAIGAAGSLRAAAERWAPVPVDDVRTVLVTRGDTLARVALGFDAILADVYWIRAVQHYGRDRRSLRYAGRYELLQPLVEVATTLDPYFATAYQFGALFLAEPMPNGPGRLDQAVDLLEKGLEVEPARWQYAQYLGFLHYWHSGDRVAAARAFDRAARMPGAPLWLQPLVASMLEEGGDREAARAVLTEMARSEERWIRDLATRKLRELDAR
jgi:tetratricopeptide (TPR) repeat protein